MRPICLIPARSGSKGLPNKNMLFLDGKPMMFHTIDAAIESGCFEKEDIYVSTDSELYKEICETRGIQVLLRPQELATDFSTSYDFTEHFLQDFADDQVFVLLQVTSPLRNGTNIKEALDLYREGEAENVVSFSKIEKSPNFFTELDDQGYAKDICGVDKGYRRQNDKRSLYAPNGAIYITSKKAYLTNQSYFTEWTKAYIMRKEDSIDVDDRLDFTSVIGRLYFDYQKREVKNKSMYREAYKNRLSQGVTPKWVIGDSRTVHLSLDGFSNLSIGGVTAATVAENLALFEGCRLETLVLALGVNDLITDYSLEEIKIHFRKIVDFFSQDTANFFIVEIAHTLFRDSVDNDDIALINQFLRELAKEKNVSFITVNSHLTDYNSLRYAYTSDGLHFNEQGQSILNELIEKQVQG